MSNSEIEKDFTMINNMLYIYFIMSLINDNQHVVYLLYNVIDKW